MGEFGMTAVMTPEEERACWTAMLWRAASRGDDPEDIWGPVQELTEKFTSICVDLHDLDLFIRSIQLGNFKIAKMCSRVILRG